MQDNKIVWRVCPAKPGATAGLGSDMASGVMAGSGGRFDTDDAVDLGRLSRLILCIIALAAGIAASICGLRIGLDTRIWAPFCAWIVVTFILAAPVAVLSLLSLEREARSALVGSAIAATVLIMLGLSALGVLGLALITLGAAFGLARLLQLQRLAPSRKSWPAVISFLALFLAYFIALAGTRYASFIADFLALTGRASADVYFHWSIANALRFFGHLAIGINGLTDLPYYPLSHILAERVASLAGSDTGFGFIANRAVVIVPLCLAAFAQAALAFDAERQLRPSVIACLVGLVVLCNDAFIGSSYDSESHILGLAFLGLTLPALRYAMRPVTSFRLTTVIWLGLLLCLACATVSKVTTGFIILTLIGYVALRSTWRRPLVLVGLWLAALAVAYLLFHKVAPTNAISAKLGSIIGNFRVDESWLNPVRYYCLAAVTLILLILSARRDGGFRARLRGGQLPLVELLLVAVAASTLPCLLLPIYAGAYYMINPQAWVAVPIAVVVGYPLLRQGYATLRQGITPRRLAGAIVVLAFGGLVLVEFAGFLKLRLAQAVSQETFIRTGDGSFFADRKKNTVLKDLGRSVPYLASASYYRPDHLNLPALKIVSDLRQLREAQGNDLIAYLSPHAQDYWSLSENCFSKSMLIFGASGVPLIDGLPPLSTQCDRDAVAYGFFLVTKRSNDDPRSDDDVCRLALAQGFHAVARIESLAGVDRVVQCKAN